MSNQLYDVKGYVGDLATNSGLSELSKFALSHTDNAQVKKLFRLGRATDIEKLKAGLEELTGASKSVKATIDNLLKLLDKCDKIAIISNGMEPK